MDHRAAGLNSLLKEGEGRGRFADPGAVLSIARSRSWSSTYTECRRPPRRGLRLRPCTDPGAKCRRRAAVSFEHTAACRRGGYRLGLYCASAPESQSALGSRRSSRACPAWAYHLTPDANLVPTAMMEGGVACRGAAKEKYTRGAPLDANAEDAHARDAGPEGQKGGCPCRGG
jgi:hypothetical protein